MGALDLNNNEQVIQQHYVFDNNPDVLTKIYDDHINLAVYMRDVSDEVNQFVRNMLQQVKSYSFTEIIEPVQLKNTLTKTLPADDNKDAFLEDLYMICDMYAVLFGQEKIGLRLTVLEHAMCPRFHVDKLYCRLLTTYGGMGTEWLSEDNLDRSRLGRGNMGLPDIESGIYFKENCINQLNSSDVAMFKGESWPRNGGKGIVHRSPTVSSDNPRLLLSLDIV